MTAPDESTELKLLVEKASAGADEAYEQLLAHTYERLQRMTRRMLRNYPGVRRWEQTDDVFQSAAMRLHRSLREVRPNSIAAFFGLASTQIRRTLIDLGRHYYGPQGMGAKHYSDCEGKAADDGVLRQHTGQGSGPQSLAQWTEFHEAVEQLPADPREVFDLIWYVGLPQKEVAQLLGVSLPTVQRRWYLAQHLLFQATGGLSPLNEDGD